MCMFSYDNQNIRSVAYKKGIKKFECGSCPECLQKKSRLWALRCSMEAKNNVGMMITLTYDTYVYNAQGQIIGERLPDDMSLSKKDAQNFIKRLRAKFPDKKIKYLLTAERGKRTNRPHYHALIFGLVFDDLVKYKKSKRGNIIYRSKTLEKIWQGGKEKKGGICTVDCINISAKTARYCTKYCAKDSGADDTFMLFSQGIGDIELLENFNGKNYWIDGREYSIPRLIWKKYIENKYNIQGFSKYVPPAKLSDLEFEYRNYLSIYAKKRSEKRYNDENKRFNRSKLRHKIFQYYRDNDVLYKNYIKYWQRKNILYNRYRPSSFQRILALPNNKYLTYKDKALGVYQDLIKNIPYVPPRSKSYAMFKRLHREKESVGVYQTRHYTPTDRKSIRTAFFIGDKFVYLREKFGKI